MKQIGQGEDALRPGDWIVIAGARHEVATVERDAHLLRVVTTRGEALTLAASTAASCLYSRAEDRHGETALNLRVQEVMLMSQLQIHEQIGDGEYEARVRGELVNTLAEVRRRMIARRQRPSEALPLFFTSGQG